MITKTIDSYVKTLIREKQLIWCCHLSDGSLCYSDFERPNEEHPWNRLKKYLKETSLKIVKVEVLGLGAPRTVLAENPNGLDGIFLSRGLIKDISLEAAHDPLQFQQMICGVWSEESQKIEVNIFYWPEQSEWATKEQRLVTPENYNFMHFQTDELKEKLAPYGEVL